VLQAAIVPGGSLPPRSGHIRSYLYQRSPTHKHRGIDIGAPVGTPVRSAVTGTVTHAYSSLGPGFSGYGRVVVVRADPGGPWTLYSHLDEVWVRSGQHVSRGTPLGTVGRTCFNKSDPTKRCNLPHLHFEVSTRPYPQPSEAPRLDPYPWATGGGAGGAGALLALAAAGAAGYWAWKRYS
jgi:murein DD-endopeptidase MepM/ murein hydrolase activator NlpD